MKIKRLSPSQVASITAGITGIAVTIWPQIIANWATIEPGIQTALKAHWFDHHPILKGTIVAAAFLITMYARSLAPNKSGIPGQDKTVTSLLYKPVPPDDQP